MTEKCGFEEMQYTLFSLQDTAVRWGLPQAERCILNLLPVGEEAPQAQLTSWTQTLAKEHSLSTYMVCSDYYVLLKAPRSICKLFEGYRHHTRIVRNLLM